MHVVAPEVGDEGADWLGLGEFLAVDLDQIGEDIDGVGGRREHTDAALRRQPETVRGRAGQIQARVRLLEGFGQHAPLGHVPVLAFPLEFIGGPDLRQHRDGFFPQAARVPGIDPQAGLLIGVGAARAQLDAAIGELVQ